MMASARAPFRPKLLIEAAAEEPASGRSVRTPCRVERGVQPPKQKQKVAVGDRGRLQVCRCCTIG